ncbi:glycosyltransferase family 2 protein [Hymenobacter crusticola]|uniref:Glycosyltransferase n=1 Tax=Hymenobacter crusticola TaxID=1770526 RepID=A0A243WHN2_9BACT|nr:glycosyltransferase family 2 protein [Hymenobacter crusticola]OUJ75351.1 glycosyltransferase [Hymenobacter crusticola]
MPEYSVVVPVYQGEATIRPLTLQLQACFRELGQAFEIIFVCDGGPDNSWQVIQTLRTELGNDIIKAVQLSRNFGQHNALLCGFGHARGRFIITMDEDLQHRPADIARLLHRQAEADYDVVYGKYETLQHSTFRNITSRAMGRLLRLGIPDLHPDYSAFRLIKAEVARQCLTMRNSYTFLDGYLTWVTNHVASVPVVHQERTVGKSAYTVGKLVAHSINIFATFSDLPIRLLSVTSVVVFLLTSAYSIYVLVRKFMYNDFLLGFPSLIISIGFGVGLLLLGMGILGEYTHRINLKTTRRPNFIERKKLL